MADIERFSRKKNHLFYGGDVDGFAENSSTTTTTEWAVMTKEIIINELDKTVADTINLPCFYNNDYIGRIDKNNRAKRRQLVGNRARIQKAKLDMLACKRPERTDC